MAQRLQDLGLRFERYDNARLMSKMAFGMFDTRKSHKCAPQPALPPVLVPLRKMLHAALGLQKR